MTVCGNMNGELRDVGFPTEGTHNGIRLRVWAWEKVGMGMDNTFCFEMAGVHAYAFRDFFSDHWKVMLDWHPEVRLTVYPDEYTVPDTDLYFFMGDLCRPGTDIPLELTAREVLEVLKTIDEILGGGEGK